MRVAAYQAPLLRSGSLEVLDLIRKRVEWCEAEGVAILCCPEAILGGLADDAPNPNRSIYEAGDQMPVFQVGGLTFGIVICNDSNYLEPARIMAARGATALFVPTNNGLRPQKTYAGLTTHARNVDIARAVENSMWVIRADVAGEASGLTSAGASGIVDPDGMVRAVAAQSVEDVVMVDLDTMSPGHCSLLS